MSEHGNGPVKEFRAGSVKAAVWKNVVETDGRMVVRHSVKIEKRFFDQKTQEWRNSDYLFANDLPRLRLVAERAFEFIVLGESQDE